MICGNSGLISLCGPEIMELPFQEALKGSPLLNLFVQEMSGSLNWEPALEGTENYLLVRNRSVELDNRTYRVGGDKFLLICRNCSPEYPDLAADLIRVMIRESNRAYGIPPCEIAVGTALREPGQSFADLEKLADDRMYVCKMQMKATGYSD